LMSRVQIPDSRPKLVSLPLRMTSSSLSAWSDLGNCTRTTHSRARRSQLKFAIQRRQRQRLPNPRQGRAAGVRRTGIGARAAPASAEGSSAAGANEFHALSGAAAAGAPRGGAFPFAACDRVLRCGAIASHGCASPRGTQRAVGYASEQRWQTGAPTRL